MTFLLLLAGPACASVDMSAEEGWVSLADMEIAVTPEQVQALFAVYAPGESAGHWFRRSGDTVEVRLGAEELSAMLAALPSWRRLWPSPDLYSEAEPLKGWRIALDPGHMGGSWAPMEGRSFRIGEGPLAREGDLVLATAYHLKHRLEAMGAEVFLVRERIGPVTDRRPDDFRAEAAKENRSLTDAEVLRAFLRDDIRERARRLDSWEAHVVFAIHVNAAAWPEPENFSFVGENHGHVLVNGAYLQDELSDAEQRQLLILRWLSGYHGIEETVARAVADRMAAATGLEPFVYTGPNAVRVNDNPYVWARNLMASRIFRAPVVYLEPWVLNAQEVYPWGSVGDYAGTRTFEGEERASLPRTYAAFVAQAMKMLAEERARP